MRPRAVTRREEVSGELRRGVQPHSVLYILGVVVVVLAILFLLGLT